MKHLKQDERANNLLDSADWSACLREFSLARAVLGGNNSEAARVMRDIGKQGEIITQLGYHTWPLFDEFRGTIEFQEAYEAIFGIPFMAKISESVKANESAIETSSAPRRKARKPRQRPADASTSGHAQPKTR